LQSLGYSGKEARDALGGVPTEVEGREARLKAALQLLSGERKTS
jgi:Holliday junction resolvasome RuvABC DNA-binding subunit